MRLAGDQPAAEASYRRALDVARAQRARTRELHAATSLSRVLRDTRQTAEARTVLTEVYGWFFVVQLACLAGFVLILVVGA
jgi:adenylate cyclase